MELKRHSRKVALVGYQPFIVKPIITYTPQEKSRESEFPPTGFMKQGTGFPKCKLIFGFYYNRTSMELKRLLPLSLYVGYQPFNRTSMELKQWKAKREGVGRTSFNRTSMELKQILRQTYSNYAENF